MVRQLAHSMMFGVLLAAGCGGGSGSGGDGGGPPNPIPSIASVDPAAAVAGGPDFYIRVFGAGFVAASTVEWNGQMLPTTFVNSTQVYALIAAADRTSSGTYSASVFNPAPGGGLSSSVSVLVGPGPAAPAGVGVIQLVSAAPDGSPGNGNTYTAPTLSADGRYVAFQSDSTNLVPGPASGFTDIYVRDTCLGAPAGCAPSTTRVSVANDGSLPNGNSRSPAISADGRYVAFDSSATNLFSGSTQMNGAADVFLRDTCIGAPASCVPTTTLISLADDGSQANGDARAATIGAGGRFVIFGSLATNLAPGFTNALSQIYLHDTCLGVSAGCNPSTTPVSMAGDGTQGNGPSGVPSMSADGRYIAFPAPTNILPPSGGIALRDTCFGAPQSCTPSVRNIFVSYSGGSVQNATAGFWKLSANARYSGFESLAASTLAPGAPNEPIAAFVYDSCIGASLGCVPRNDEVSLTYNGGLPDNGSGEAASSDDGNHVVFNSIADNLLTYAYRSSAMYVRLTCANAAPGCIPTTYLLSVDSYSGVQGNSQYSDYPAITPDGHYAVFVSTAPNWPAPLSNPSVLTQVWLARVY